MRWGGLGWRNGLHVVKNDEDNALLCMNIIRVHGIIYPSSNPQAPFRIANNKPGTRTKVSSYLTSQSYTQEDHYIASIR